MPNPIPQSPIIFAGAPVIVGVSELNSPEDYSFVFSDNDRSPAAAWRAFIASRFQLSRAHAVEVEQVQKLLFDILRRTEQLAKDPYEPPAGDDQFEYDSIIRPVKAFYRAKINFRGRAVPLPIEDD
jgi:hypothetical protein